MGCGDSKTAEDEEQKNKEENKEEINNNQNEKKENENKNDSYIENNKDDKLMEKKIKKIEKQSKIKNEKDNKTNGQTTKISIRENESKRNYEKYNEVFDETEEEKEINEEEIKEKEHQERKDFLVNLKFKNIFKNDNIDKNNSTIMSDTSQKVKITFIPSQKSFPKISKYFDPIQGVDGLFWEINLQASRNEIMAPLWLEKNKEIVFYVSGKWRIDEEQECDCKGIPEPKNNYEKFTPNLPKYQFYKGALVGRVIYGEKFQIYDGLRYESEYDGPLILKMNLNSVWGKEKPSGALSVKVKGAIYVNNIYDMEERIGWIKLLKTIELNNLEDIPDYKIPSLEKMIMILFNKARYNSKLFAYQYLDNMKTLTPNSIKIYNEFMTNTKQNLPLKINVSIVKFLQEFYSPFVSGNKNNDSSKNNNESLIILRTNKIVQKYLNKCFNEKKPIHHISIIKYKNKSPFHLASRLIFENEVRENIFNSRCEEMSMITIQANEGFKSNTFYTIVVLSNEKGNNNINYEISKNVKNFINEEQKNNNDHNIISMVKINLNPLPNIFSNQNSTKNFYDFN